MGSTTNTKAPNESAKEDLTNILSAFHMRLVTLEIALTALTNHLTETKVLNGEEYKKRLEELAKQYLEAVKKQNEVNVTKP
jgi:NAD(P)H-dependent FMN reductase